MMINVLDDDREEISSIMTTMLPVLNTNKLEDVEDNNNRPKRGRPKNATSKKIRCLDLDATAFINEAAVKNDEEKKTK